MAALKSPLMDKIYDLKNQIASSNTGKHESDLVSSLRKQMKLLKKENENKTFIMRSLLQNQNHLSNIETNVFLQQRKPQSFDKNISEEIPMIIVFHKVNIQLKSIQKNN